MTAEELQGILDSIESFDSQFDYFSDALNRAYDEGFKDGVEYSRKRFEADECI